MTISVSAGEKRHHHPSMLMVDQFSDHTNLDHKYWSDPDLDDDDRHFITCWIDLHITEEDVDPAWPPSWLYSTTQTGRNVYSTFYFKEDPYNRRYVKVKPKHSYYKHFVGPPLPAEELIADASQDDVPMGRNWQFTIGDTLEVDSTENEARALAATPDFVAAAKAPPPGFSTVAGRGARAGLVPPRRPAPLIRSEPRAIDEPAGPRLRGLKIIQ
jgi:hypothetical protein